jgi:hypothetical protein
MKEIKYTILYCVFVRVVVIPFYYGSGTIVNYGTVRFQFRLFDKLWFRFRFYMAKSYGPCSGSTTLLSAIQALSQSTFINEQLYSPCD